MLDKYWTYSAEDISNYATKRFSLNAIGRKLNEIYNDLLEPHPDVNNNET